MSTSSQSGSSAASLRSFSSSIPSTIPEDDQLNISAATTAPPPAYTSLFPNQTTTTIPDPTNMMRDRREQPRYTTITLREIRFPNGCPCHPATPQAGREAAILEHVSGLRAACDWIPHARPRLVEDSRKRAAELERQRATSQGSVSSSSSTSNSGAGGLLQPPLPCHTTTTTSVASKSRNRRPSAFFSRRVSGSR
ncbi:uncharacterized protein HMPREF1541_01214 [Cyphellophora europaea CBS 101466]|uniref:Uncharacterized protein n=1 Tax=Cyphellophora europaea (strain CBS 101466) TaxID=1220924 RepID=W2SGL9_CYPE1|nr:uncharacterized protein HMPREF1541_01214 [Cyphellophora europaea CBS 101466]ETN47024.1 hypothetical protein HMPREF1541_01214 [Cyphellophora europaea CBS 101466]